MTARIVGAPVDVPISFLNGIDPSKVELSLVSPRPAPPAVFTVGIDDNAKKISAGLYMLTFTPLMAGRWWVVGDGFDYLGKPVASADYFVDVEGRPAPIPA